MSISTFTKTSLTRTEALAKAFKGQVVEDQGYRGVIFVPDEGEGKYLRFHPRAGVHLVKKIGKNWKSLTLVLGPDDIIPFLDELGLTPQTRVPNPVDVLARAFLGEVVDKFATGGGVIRVSWGLNIYYLRMSQISGLDLVHKVLSKWRTYKSLWSRRELFEIVTYLHPDFKPSGQTIEEALASIRREVIHDGEHDKQDSPDGGGDQGSDQAHCAAEGPAPEVPRQEEGATRV